MSDKPYVSVIVPVYNDLAGLRVCLGALEAQSYPPACYEVIVVDNASLEAVGDSLGEFAHVTAAYQASRGSYAARNRGLEVARGAFIAFTDADCRPAPDWLESGVAALLANPDCGLVAGRIRVVARDPAAPTMVEHYDLEFGFPQARYVESGFGATANLFTRREVFDVVGGFRAELQSGGDREWGLRVRDAGYPALYVEAASVDHPARSSWRELIKKTTRTNRGMFALARMQGLGTRHTLRLVLSDLRPPVGWMLQVLRRKGTAGLKAKLSALAVLMFNRWLRALVWLRLEAAALRGPAGPGGTVP